MQAIILAAGMGKRLKRLTANNTKCMVHVNGETLISRMLRQLDGRQLSQIVIVTGYEGRKLTDYIDGLNIKTKIVYIDNPIYDKTNNIYSLSLAKEYLISDDTLLFESDIIFEDDVLDELISDTRETLALVDKYESWMDGTCLKLDDEDRITDFISGKDFDFCDTSGCYKTVNIYKLSKEFSATHYVPFMGEQSVIFDTSGNDFRYDADDIISFFGTKTIDTLVLINPDNPSGNYIKKSDIEKLTRWCSNRGITFILDESFADFSDEQDNSLIDQAILEKNPKLIVIKSISKSYGVPGLRLGVLVSGDESLIADIKKDVSIWNINSFAEFFMQIQEKYKKDYAKGLVRYRRERSRFVSELNTIKGLRTFPTQANFVMVEIREDISAHELTKRLYSEHNILIKDLTSKIAKGEYIRLAVRSEEDNNRLIKALRGILNDNE